MKNKNLQQMQLELIGKLLNAVNSKEEFDYLEAEKTQLLSLLSRRSLAPDQLNKFMEI